MLSPLDRLVLVRPRMVDLFQFDYTLEMYKPVEQRKWGYWALPVLHGDRLVGKVNATYVKKSVRYASMRCTRTCASPPAMATAVDAEIADLADWLSRTR